MFAGITFWFPKMFGRMMNETLGKIHFWGTIIPFNVIFIPLFITGIAGEQRRIYNYAQLPGAGDGPRCSTCASRRRSRCSSCCSFQFVFLFNFFWSLLQRPKRAGANPWRSTTLEWTADSPPPHGNFAELPTVYRGPYEYGVPGRDGRLLAAERPIGREGERR